MLQLIWIILFLIGIIFLYLMKKIFKISFNIRVFTALIAGIIFGGIIQIIQMLIGTSLNSDSIFIIFMSIFSGLYMNLLQFIVIPLILVSITTAIIEAPTNSKIGKSIFQILTVLLTTVAIAAIIGIIVVQVFNINGEQILHSQEDTVAVQSKKESIKSYQEQMEDMNFADYILAPIPTNFSFLTGQGDTAALSTVLFGGFLGFAIIQVRKRKKEKVEPFINLLTSLKEIVLSMVKEILKLTPFAIFALMTSFMATSSLASLGELAKFLLATYVAIILMYLIHLLILLLFGINPLKYIIKSWPVLLFGFGSRSSLASMPLNIETQIELLGSDEATANLSATLGATIGQNGCAGIYPAMIVTMVAPVYGFDINLAFIISLILIIVVSSFGIAGVGGGATFAAIAVLSIMGFPIEMAAILAGIEPLIDMARTALNISDSMVAGIVVSKINKKTNLELLNS